MMERTDRPSKDCLLFQNWMSEGETAVSRASGVRLPPSAIPCCVLTVLEGEELKDAVHDGDDDGEAQQVGVGFQKGHLAKRRFRRLTAGSGPRGVQQSKDPGSLTLTESWSSSDCSYVSSGRKFQGERAFWAA